MVSRCRFAGEEECARHHFCVGILPQPVINDDDSQRVQQLSLIFVDAFDLAIEDRVRVHELPRRRFEPIGKPCFGLAL